MKEENIKFRCGYCGKDRDEHNRKRHITACATKYKCNHLEEIEGLKAEIENLKDKIKNLEEMNFQLNSQIKGKELLTMEQLVSMKSHNTKSSYVYHWGNYLNYCKINNLDCISKSTAMEYFKNLRNRSIESNMKLSTLNLIRSILVLGFKHLFELNIGCLLPREKSTFAKTKPKYVCQDEELYEYLRYLLLELKDEQSFLANYILCFSGCRCHSVSMLKKKDLNFNTLLIRDYKTKKDLPFNLTLTMSDMLQKFLELKSDEEFMFYHHPLDAKKYSNDGEIVKRRTQVVGPILRLQMKASPIFQHVDLKKICLGPHVYRKTVCNTQFREFLKQGFAQSRKAINHTPGTLGVFSYLDTNVQNQFYNTLIKRIDDLVDNRENDSHKIFETNFIDSI